MSYKQIIRMQKTMTKQVGGYHHPRTQPRKPLKISIRQQAEHLLHGRLTTRDLELVRALIGVGMLTRQQIQRLFFGDHPKVASNRLARLYHYHFLDRSSYWLEDMGPEGFEPCYIYTVGAVGLEAFALRMGVGRGDVPFTPARYTLSREDHFLLHDLRISEMFTQLQVGAKEIGEELMWFNESAAILRREQEELVRPDGIAVLIGPQRHTPFFIEMDRGYTDWPKKVAAYEKARQQSPWAVTLRVDSWRPSVFPTVLCVVPAALEGMVQKEIESKRPQTKFYIQSWERFLAADIFVNWYDSSSGQIVALLPEMGNRAVTQPL